MTEQQCRHYLVDYTLSLASVNFVSQTCNKWLLNNEALVVYKTDGLLIQNERNAESP